MSLYSFEEICQGCTNVKWHSCPNCYGGEPRFCHCEIHAEESADHSTGKCGFHRVNVKKKDAINSIDNTSDRLDNRRK
jgi:hypothetical protein